MNKLIIVDLANVNIDVYEISSSITKDTDTILESLGYSPQLCTVLWGDNVNISFKGVIE